MQEKAVAIRIGGYVQGVGFRYYCQRGARHYHIKGWCRNEAEGSVYVEAQGLEDDLKAFLDYLRKGPPSARVESFELKNIPLSNHYPAFRIEY